MIALGVSPHEMTLGGDTPLCAAVRMGRAECVRVLFLSGTPEEMKNAQQIVAPNRSLPPTLNPTSSVRGSEDF